MLSPALFVMYTRTVSADAGNAASAARNHACLKPKRADLLTAALLGYAMRQCRRQGSSGSRCRAEREKAMIRGTHGPPYNELSSRLFPAAPPLVALTRSGELANAF